MGRWTIKYIRSMRERHNGTKGKPYIPETGEVVLVFGDSKNLGNEIMALFVSGSKIKMT